MTKRTLLWLTGIIGSAIFCLASSLLPTTAYAANQWESEILAYEAADLASPPAKGSVVITGSSTILYWTTIKPDLAPLDIIPRGFGGSTTDDLDYYLQRIVLVYEPRAVVIYEGDNDIGFGATPQHVADRMSVILSRISARLPSARVYVLSIKPSPLRWAQWPLSTQANALLAALCAADARYTFINAAPALLGSNGLPKPEYYQPDQLHLNALGYQAWTAAIRPTLHAQQLSPPPPDAVPPAVPSGLVATAATSSRIDLRWNASSDAGIGLAGYRVSRNGTFVANTTATTFANTGLASNTAYTYTVSAYDRAAPNPNESAQSAAASATTPTNGTPAPTVTLSANPTSISSGATTQLSWSTANATSCTASGGWSGSKATSGSAQSAALSNNTTFSLACTGPGGNTTGSTTVTVTTPAPTVTLTANPTSLLSGGTTQLTWSSANATTCNATGGWSGSKATSGSAQSAVLSGNTTFSLACSGPGGTTTGSATVTVTTPAPTVTLTANPASLISGGATQLTWSSTNATSCTASGGWSGAKATSGIAQSDALGSNTTFSLACSGAGGSATTSATVTVTTPAPTVTLTANPASLISGGATQLTWSSTNATTCTASGGWSGSRASAGSESSPALSGPTTFALACTGPGGSGSAATSIAVAQPPPIPTVTLTASPTALNSGQTTQLAWTTSDATSCTASGGWSGNRGTSGAEASLPLTTATSFTLACTGPGGTATGAVSVSINEPAPTLTISASPASVAYGGATQLTWTASHATGCTASGDWNGSKSLAGSEQIAGISKPSTFNLACTGSAGEARAAVTIDVAAAPAPNETVTVTASGGGGGGGVEWPALLALLSMLVRRRPEQQHP